MRRRDLLRQAALLSWTAGLSGSELLRPRAAPSLKRPHDASLSSTNVRIEGALGNGVADDGPAFRAAIGSNREIIVPPGTYNIETMIGVGKKSDFIIRLLSGAVIVHSQKLDGKLFNFNNCQRFRITADGAGKIDVSAAPNSGPGEANDAMGLFDCTDYEIDHLWFYSGTDHGSAGGDSQIFAASDNGAIHHNIFEAAKDCGVYVSGPNSSAIKRNLLVRENTFLRCANACLSKRRFQRMVFINNEVRQCVNGAGSAEAEFGPGILNTYRDNVFIENIGPCIISRISENDDVTNNKFINNLSKGIVVLQGTSRATVSGNRFLAVPGQYASESPQRCIYLEPRRYQGITYNATGNVVAGNSSDGIYQFAEEADKYQDQNVYRDNRISRASKYYILRGPRSSQDKYQSRYN